MSKVSIEELLKELLPVRHTREQLELAIELETEIIESSDEEIFNMAATDFTIGDVDPDTVRKRFRARRAIDLLEIEILRLNELLAKPKPDEKLGDLPTKSIMVDLGDRYASLDDLEQINYGICAQCGCVITEENNSGWRVFVEGGTKTQSECITCHEKESGARIYHASASAYAAYCANRGTKSVNGESLPKFEEQSIELKTAWEAAIRQGVDVINGGSYGLVEEKWAGWKSSDPWINATPLEMSEILKPIPCVDADEPEITN